MSQPLEDESASGGTTSTSGAGSGEGSASKAGTTAPEASGPEVVSKSDHDAVVARMKAADVRASKVEAELKAIKDKDLPAQEKLQRDHEELVKSHEALVETNKSLALENAFLKANTFKWKDPEAALKLADLSEVEIDDAGKVTGLEAALKGLATTKKWLLEDEPADDKESGNKNASSAGAPPMGAGATNRGTGADKNRLKSTYSALRMRG
jgi:hypothetical protein